MSSALRVLILVGAVLIGSGFVAAAAEPDDSEAPPKWQITPEAQQQIDAMQAAQPPRKCPSIWIPVPDSEQGEGFLCQPRKPHKMRCATGYEWQEKSAEGITYLVGCVPSK